MKITTTIIAIMGATHSRQRRGTAYAQTPATADGDMFVNISLGGQFQSREFSSLTTFELFNETGSVTANQTVGNGFVFDITGGYRIWQNVAVAVGVSTSNGSGEAAALAVHPEPVVRRNADAHLVSPARPTATSNNPPWRSTFRSSG